MAQSSTGLEPHSVSGHPSRQAEPDQEPDQLPNVQFRNLSQDDFGLNRKEFRRFVQVREPPPISRHSFTPVGSDQRPNQLLEFRNFSQNDLGHRHKDSRRVVVKPRIRPTGEQTKKSGERQLKGRAKTSDQQCSTEKQGAALTKKRTAEINPATMNLMQMLNTFIETFFPNVKAKANLKYRNSYILLLPDADLSEPSLLRFSVGTLASAYVGTVYKHQALIYESKKLYGNALNALSRHITAVKPKPKEIPQILASIMLLSMYDEAITHPQVDEHSWLAHYDGALALLRTLGPDCMDPQADAFAELSFMNLKVPFIFNALARRKGTGLDEKQWLRPDYGTVGQEFFCHGITLSRLVEQTEQACFTNVTTEELITLWDAIVKFRNGFLDWNWRNRCDHGKSSRPKHAVHVSDTSRFDLTIEEHCFMTSSSAFVSFNPPANEGEIYFDGTLRMFTLITLCANLRLSHFRRDLLQQTETWLEVAGVRSHALDEARAICRSMYNHAKLPTQGRCFFMVMLCTLAKNLFEELGETSELGWCQGMLCASRLRLARLKAEQPRSLCRMGDLTEGLSSLSSFRARNPKLGASVYQVPAFSADKSTETFEEPYRNVVALGGESGGDRCPAGFGRGGS